MVGTDLSAAAFRGHGLETAKVLPGKPGRLAIPPSLLPLTVSLEEMETGPLLQSLTEAPATRLPAEEVKDHEVLGDTGVMLQLEQAHAPAFGGPTRQREQMVDFLDQNREGGNVLIADALERIEGFQMPHQRVRVVEGGPEVIVALADQDARPMFRSCARSLPIKDPKTLIAHDESTYIADDRRNSVSSFDYSL